MQVNGFMVQLTSEDPDRLFNFYKDVVGLTVAEGMGDRAFNLGSATLSIDSHSETHGQAAEPHRRWVNFFVDDVQAERERLEAAGVPFIRKEGREYWGGVISTFVDPDGNYGQVIEVRREEATAPA